ncbi:hypothetical protein NG895_18605 [Aeoliella sp. ICT_H6.2]|uniref:Uncharacterized protein n=1 Tax=Aeoliella straminimaris TaxID=2954799 RepID=A0A9X2FBN8_9BACT|nr:hypothetical protein [Aeoliella straminimaris]MCO6045915.1 hypothetical protein [Aeoliella straminimaris]
MSGSMPNPADLDNLFPGSDVQLREFVNWTNTVGQELQRLTSLTLLSV